MKSILLIFIFSILLSVNALSQENTNYYSDSVVFIGEKTIDSSYFVYFKKTYQAILIDEDDISLIQDDTSFSSMILKTGSVYFFSSKFYSSFLTLYYKREPLIGRVDSSVFVSYYKEIADDVNVDTLPYKRGSIIFENDHIIVYHILVNHFFVGVINIRMLDKLCGYEGRRYIIPGITNIWVKFVVPLKE